MPLTYISTTGIANNSTNDADAVKTALETLDTVLASVATGSSGFPFNQDGGTIDGTVIENSAIGVTTPNTAEFTNVEIDRLGIGLNPSAMNGSALLQMNSTTQGLLPPRMTTAQVGSISGPSFGLIVYDETAHELKVYTDLGWISLASISGQGVHVGTIAFYAGSTPPSGWIECTGGAVSRTTYSALYAVTGDVFGAGDGSTTFNLPDLLGRVPMGKGSGGGLTARTIGDSSGSETHQLVDAELSSHGHNLYGNGFVEAEPKTGPVAVDSVTDTSNFAGTGTHLGYASFIGSNTPHNNVQPFLAVTGMVKY